MRRRVSRAGRATVALLIALLTAGVPGACGESQPDAYPLADVTLTDLEGAQVELDPPFDQPVLVNLWAVWCAPCRREFPRLDAAASDWGDRARVIGLNTDGTIGGAEEFVAETGVSFEQLVDTDRESLVRFGVSGLPATVALRPDGTVADVHHGEISRAELDDLLAKTSTPAD